MPRGIDQLFALLTISPAGPEDKLGIFLLKLLVRIILSSTKNDFVEIDERFNKHANGLDWILFGILRDGKTTVTLRRGDPVR